MATKKTIKTKETKTKQKNIKSNKSYFVSVVSLLIAIVSLSLCFINQTEIQRNNLNIQKLKISQEEKVENNKETKVVEKDNNKRFRSYELLIGLTDKTLEKVILDSNDVNYIVIKTCEKYKTGFTLTKSIGGYVGNQGEFHVEDSYILRLNLIEESKLLNIVDELEKEMNIDSIMVEEIEKVVYNE